MDHQFRTSFSAYTLERDINLVWDKDGWGLCVGKEGLCVTAATLNSASQRKSNCGLRPIDCQWVWGTGLHWRVITHVVKTLVVDGVALPVKRMCVCVYVCTWSWVIKIGDRNQIGTRNIISKSGYQILRLTKPPTPPLHANHTHQATQHEL